MGIKNKKIDDVNQRSNYNFSHSLRYNSSGRTTGGSRLCEIISKETMPMTYSDVVLRGFEKNCGTKIKIPDSRGGGLEKEYDNKCFLLCLIEVLGSAIRKKQLPLVMKIVEMDRMFNEIYKLCPTNNEEIDISCNKDDSRILELGGIDSKWHELCDRFHLRVCVLNMTKDGEIYEDAGMMIGSPHHPIAGYVLLRFDHFVVVDIDKFRETQRTDSHASFDAYQKRIIAEHEKIYHSVSRIAPISAR